MYFLSETAPVCQAARNNRSLEAGQMSDSRMESTLDGRDMIGS
jgi:hypothetical protein